MVRDVYHVSQHLHQCGRNCWARQGRAGVGDDRLSIALNQNGPAMIQQIESEAASASSASSSTHSKSLETC